MMPCYHSGSPPLAGKASIGTPCFAGYPGGITAAHAVGSSKAQGCSLPQGSGAMFGPPFPLPFSKRELSVEKGGGLLSPSSPSL